MKWDEENVAEGFFWGKLKAFGKKEAGRKWHLDPGEKGN